MDKYGVELDEDKVKEASKGAKPSCPLCGKALNENGFCPEHGSEPFEKRQPPKRGDDGG